MKPVAPILGILLASCAADLASSIAHDEDLRRPDSARLASAIRDEDPGVRARAALAMGRIQSAAYADDLTHAALSDADKGVRVAAIFALGQLGLGPGDAAPDTARAACVQLLSSDDVDVLAAAVEAVGKLGGVGTAEPVTPLLKHPSPRVRVEAAHALFRIRWVPVWRGDSKEPAAVPGESVAALIEALGDKDSDGRCAAAYAFARFGEPQAVKPLLGLLHDPNEWTRLFALRAIGRSKNNAAAEPLLEALKDESERVRAEAVNALLALQAGDLIPASAAKDRSFHVRTAAAPAMKEDVLQTLLTDESPTVAAAAVDALAKQKKIDLEPRLADARWPMRAAAARAARHLGADGVPILRKAMDDPDKRVRQAALGALGETEGVDDLIEKGLASTDIGERTEAISALAKRKNPEKLKLLEKIYRDSPGVDFVEAREAVAEAAAEIEGSESFLLKLAEDPASSVRAKARAALRKRNIEIAPEPPSGELSPFLGESFEEDPVVVLETSKGNIEIRCLAREAPVHVANFVSLVRKGFYDGTIWHRVVSNFVIQGGDPRGDGSGGPGYALRDEINRARYVRGAVGMPKAGKDTGGCQIFITHTPTPHLDGNYTVYGVVTSGMDVVDRIEVGDTILKARIR